MPSGVEVHSDEWRIVGRRSTFLSETKTASFGRRFGSRISTLLLKWRRGRDSNSRKAFTFAGFQDRCFKPLSHPSVTRRAL